jgi:hypothetical protein
LRLVFFVIIRSVCQTKRPISNLTASPKSRVHFTYALDEILFATLTGVLCGVDDWGAVELLSRECLG